MHAEAIDLRDRQVSIELWMLATIFTSFIGLVFGMNHQNPTQLSGKATYTPMEQLQPVHMDEAAATPVPDETELDPLVIEAKPVVTGGLKVNAPDGAKVYVDGRRVGDRAIRVAAGDHRIKIRHGGVELEDIASVPPGRTISYDINFNFEVQTL